jgi:hypothetical protein
MPGKGFYHIVARVRGSSWTDPYDHAFVVAPVKNAAKTN